METVSWDDAQEFIRKLNAKNDEYVYRLPSEAEWEYAARAGTTGDYAGDLDAMAWYAKNSGRKPPPGLLLAFFNRQAYVKQLRENGGQTHPVGGKQPNAFGLFDMHGNVLEWCLDGFQIKSYIGAPTDGRAWFTAGPQKERIGRGGAWLTISRECRSAQRFWGTPNTREDFLGLRVIAFVRP